jgi:hypothetical protein
VPDESGEACQDDSTRSKGCSSAKSGTAEGATTGTDGQGSGAIFGHQTGPCQAVHWANDGEQTDVGQTAIDQSDGNEAGTSPVAGTAGPPRFGGPIGNR